MSALMSTDEAFKMATDRYLTLLGQGAVDTFDKKMVPIIKHFNTLEGVSTVFCCEGHPDVVKRGSTAYIMFALQQRGIEKLNILFRRLFEVTLEGMSDAYGLRTTDLELVMTTRLMPDTRLHYVVYSLRARFRTVDQKEWFYKAMYKLLGISK